DLTNPDNPTIYHVTIFYNEALNKQNDLNFRGEQISEKKIKINNKKYILSAYREEQFSVEAIANPPKKVLFSFYLLVDNILINTEDYITIKNIITNGEEPDETTYLSPNSNEIINFLNSKEQIDPSTISIVKFTKWLLGQKKCLTEYPMEEIELVNCQVKLNNSNVPVTIEKIPYNETLIKIPAKDNDNLSLLLNYNLISYYPYIDKVKTDTIPLPSYSLVNLKDYRSTKIEKAISNSNGEFKIGPFKISNVQEKYVEAILPFFPPGDQTRIKTKILHRYGRPIEACLDSGKFPPKISLPEKMSMEKVIPEVVKQINSAVNPDKGEFLSLNPELLLDLYASSFQIINESPDLKKILDEAVASKWRLLKIHPKQYKLTDNSTWNSKDAIAVLNDPTLADQLVNKLANYPEPIFDEFVFTKSADLLPEDKKIDVKSGIQHAMAAAALTKADYNKYKEIIKNQLKHIIKYHQEESFNDFSIEYITEFGQPLKLIIASSNEKEIVDLIKPLLDQLKNTAYDKFVNSNKDLNAMQKIKIAHLFSDSWRPFLNTPEFLTFKQQNIKDFVLTQEIFDLDGRILTGQVLGEKSEIYNTALLRATDYLNNSSKNEKDKYQWAEDFLAQWHIYMFNSFKGGFNKNDEIIEEFYKKIGIYEYYRDELGKNKN
ncbi:MAG: hypothetical protein JXB17_13770, partial [Bacteroidales bacterium]|nr:hypothetical protein [Bacteroidales bacterium]